MPFVVHAYKIDPRYMDSASFRAYIFNAVMQTRNVMLRTFYLTTANWNHKVRFVGRFGYKGGSAFVVVETDDTAWNLLDRGTNVRYAWMERGFVPKTSPRWFGSRPGYGTKAFVSLERPRPGIQPRWWSIIAMQMFESFLGENVDAAIKAAIDMKSFTGLSATAVAISALKSLLPGGGVRGTFRD